MMRASTPEIPREVLGFAEDIRNALAACARSLVPDGGAWRTPTRSTSVDALSVRRPREAGQTLLATPRH